MKAARSVAELQSKVNSVADVMVFLEVLGYTRQDAQLHGFEDLKDLSQEIYGFIDMLEPGEETQVMTHELYIEVPTTASRLAEGFALSFGWIGSLLVLFIAGASLWLSLLLPLDVTTVFMGGLFTGLLITEGPLQGFNKLFAFYHDQGNVGETKRILKRAYLTVGCVLALTVAGLYAMAVLTNFPLDLFEIGMVSLITISLHRVIYAVIYSLKKIAHLVVSYLLAFFALIDIYFGMGDLIPNAVDRYLYALVAALLILSAFAIYDQLQVLKGKSFKARGAIPSFFRPVTTNRRTIGSSFSVQFWETLPNYLFGTFFFSLLFGDRILSWFFNPIKRANGISLPFVFNSAYHAGADLALLVIFPAIIIQYAMMSPVFAQMSNATLESSVNETGKIQSFLASRYRKIIVNSVLASIVAAVALNFLAPILLPATALPPTSLGILRIASIANISLVIFLANGIFLQFMNKTMGLALVTLSGALVVLIGGLMVAPTGFQNLELAYFAATSTVAILSTFYVTANLNRVASMFFSRYI
jgi:hypothetical protein